MKKISLILFILLSSVQQCHASMRWNCFEPQFESTRVTHKQYYGERMIEPYRWRNYEEKPVKEWYNDTMAIQRAEIKAKWKRSPIIIQSNLDNMYYFK